MATTPQTSDIYEIEGGVVRRVQKTVVAEVEATQFIASLRDGNGVSTGLLPQNCIYFYRQTIDPTARTDSNTQQFIFVLQTTPRVATIKYKNGGASSRLRVEQLRISLPFVLFFVQATGSGAIGSIYPACSKKALESLDDPLNILPLPNIHSGGNGQLCTGSISIRNDAPIHLKVNAFVHSFWTSEFNLDLTSQMPEQMQRSGDTSPTMYGWAEKTEQNSLFGISDEVVYPIHSSGTFQGILRQLGWRDGNLT